MIDDEEEIDKGKYFTLFEQFEKEKSEETQFIGINSRVLIVDMLNTFIRSFTGSPAMNNDGSHVGGITGFLYSIGNAIRLTNATRCILISDGKGGSSRRRKIYPDYKNKSKPKSLNRAYNFKNADEEERAMQYQMMTLLKYLRHMPVQIISIEGTEADDVIAYTAQEIFSKQEEKITIVSSDKDFLQLVNDRITVWSPTKKKLYTPAKVEEEYGIPPSNFLLFRMLDGDASDNIPGVRGAGLKTTKKYLPMVTENTKHTIEEILEYADGANSGKKKKMFYTNLLNSKETLKLNEQLMQLESPPISAHTKLKVMELVTKEEIPTLNKHDIRLMYIHDGLSNAIPNIDEWLSKTFNILNAHALSKTHTL